MKKILLIFLIFYSELSLAVWEGSSTGHGALPNNDWASICETSSARIPAEWKFVYTPHSGTYLTDGGYYATGDHNDWELRCWTDYAGGSDPTPCDDNDPVIQWRQDSFMCESTIFCDTEDKIAALDAACSGVAHDGTMCEVVTNSRHDKDGQSSITVPWTIEYTCSGQCQVMTEYDNNVYSETYSSFYLSEVLKITVSGVVCDPEIPNQSGEHVFTFNEVTDGNSSEDSDVDGDGIPDIEDPDIDGDGIPNPDDVDQDGDGIPDKSDIDGDGIPDSNDSDIDGDGIPNSQDSDIDGDGVPNADDPTPDGPGDDAAPDKDDGAEEGDDGKEGSTGKASNCDTPPESTGDPQLSAIHKQLWINECEGSDTEEVDEGKADELTDKLGDKGDSLLQDMVDNLPYEITQGSEGGGPMAGTIESSGNVTLLESLIPQAQNCSAMQIDFIGKYTGILKCDHFDSFKQWFGWALAVLTVYSIIGLIFSPVPIEDRRSGF